MSARSSTPSANPISGAIYLIRGIRMISQPGLRRFVLIPLIINMLFFAGLSYFVFGIASEFVASWMSTIPAWLDWLEPVIKVLVIMSMLVFTYFTFTIFANFFSSPFNGPLSEAVETLHRGKTIDQSSSVMESISQLGPLMSDEIQKVVYSITRSAPFLILFLIPVINIAAPFAWLGVSAWILALQYADYPLGNHGVRFKQQRELVKQKRWLVTGFGTMVVLMTMIPFVNFLVVPAAVAGATMMIHDHYHLEEND